MKMDNKAVLVSGLSLLGAVAGIIIAVKRKSGFWGGVGWFIVGSMGGTAVGYIAAAVIPDSNDKNQ